MIKIKSTLIYLFIYSFIDIITEIKEHIVMVKNKSSMLIGNQQDFVLKPGPKVDQLET